MGLGEGQKDLLAVVILGFRALVLEFRVRGTVSRLMMRYDEDARGHQPTY